MVDIGLNDLTTEAAQTASDAAATDQSTGEWIAETVKLLDQRGYLEPLLWGKERLPNYDQPEPVQAVEPTISADTIAEAGRGVIDALGEGVTVAELVEICENNPAMVNQQLRKFNAEPEAQDFDEAIEADSE